MRNIKLLVLILALLMVTSSAFAQKDPNDPGAPDSVFFCPDQIYYPLPSGPGIAYIHIGFVNDYPVAAITAPFVWSGPLTFDSVTFRDSRVSYLEYKTVNVDLAQSRVLIGAIPVKEEELLISAGRGVFATLCFTINGTGTASLDSVFFPPLNHLYFVTSEPLSYVPGFVPGSFPVIQYYPGDVDYNQKVQVADVVYLARYVFGIFPEPPYPVPSDVNADCEINLADAVYLALFLFKSGPKPVVPGCLWNPGCAE